MNVRPTRRDFLKTASAATLGALAASAPRLYGDVKPPQILPTADIYDPVAGAWTTAGRMVAPRADHTATLLHDGTVLIAGGWSNDRALATAERFDPIAGTFAPTGRMAGSRYLHTATRLRDGKVLVVRGSLNKPEVFAIETKDILAGKAPDFRLQPKDIIFVNSRPFVYAEDLADLAVTAFLQSLVTSATGGYLILPYQQ